MTMIYDFFFCWPKDQTSPYWQFRQKVSAIVDGKAVEIRATNMVGPIGIRWPPGSYDGQIYLVCVRTEDVLERTLHMVRVYKVLNGGTCTGRRLGTPPEF